MCEVCDRGIGDDPVRLQQWLDQSDAWMRETIKRRGWAVQYVEDTDDEWRNFAYTVGLTGFGSPELVVHVLSFDSAVGLLNDLGDRVRSGAAQPRDGDEIRLEGRRPVQLFALPRPERVILRANRLHGRAPDESLPALQVVWPDLRGAWPWEPDCRGAAARQPMPGVDVDADAV